jgi:transposase
MPILEGKARAHKTLRRKTKQSQKVSFARLTTLAKGRIIGLRQAGVEIKEVADRVRKTDGTSPSARAIYEIYTHFLTNDKWDGEPSRAGGRPRALTPKQEQLIKKVLMRDVGKVNVSARHVKKCLPELRGIGDRVVQRTFDRLGFGFRHRRKKSAIGEKYKPARLKYCDWLAKQDQPHLNRFAYVDGTTFFLARTEEECRDKQRAAVGPRCWRLKDGSDSLEDQNVGASKYAKSQGKPVKIWGVFCNGRLEYWLLPENKNRKGTENMTGKRYNRMVKTYFAKWRRKFLPKFPKSEKVPLVKDFERFLRWGKTKEFDNMKAEDEAGYRTVQQHPKCSPDFNAIEGWWDVLQVRLNLTAPVEMERRSDFVKRLRRTVNWMNANLRKHGQLLCTNQKQRAREVKQLDGARCRW